MTEKIILSEVRKDLEDAIDEVFIKYQTKYDASGDIYPDDSLLLDEKTDELAVIVTRVLKLEVGDFDWCDDED